MDVILPASHIRITLLREFVKVVLMNLVVLNYQHHFILVNTYSAMVNNLDHNHAIARNESIVQPC